MKLSLGNLWWTLPLLAVGMYALVRAIVGIANVAQQGELATAAVSPHAPDVALTFDLARTVLVYFEEPELIRLKSVFYDLELHLSHPASGWSAPLHHTGLPVNFIISKQSRITKGTMIRYRKTLRLPAAGAYNLQVSGFDPAEDYADCAVVFMRPSYLGASAIWVLLLIFSIFAIVGGFVVSLIAVSQNS